MDNEKKKNGLIRLLGKLGRRCKFLQKPLMVLVVIGVSIHHLFRQLFFGVGAHRLRMRLLTGAVCACLLLTIFVIPAIADEMLLSDTETEEVTSEEETTPTPSPTPEVSDENGDSAIDDLTEVPADGDGTTPTDGEGQDADVTGGDGAGDNGDGETVVDAGTPNDDGSTLRDDEGNDYAVDDNGNILGGEDVEKLKNGLAIRKLGEQAHLPSASDGLKLIITPTVSGTNSSVDAGAHNATLTFGADNNAKLSIEVDQESVAEDKKYAGEITYTAIIAETYTGGSSSSSSTGHEYTFPSGYNLNAGTYKIKWQVKARGDDEAHTLTSDEWTITVNKGSISSANINANFKFNGDTTVNEEAVYYLTASKTDSNIPGTEQQFNSILKDIHGTVKGELLYSPIGAEGDADSYWSTPGEYRPGIKIDGDNSRNYDTQTLMLDDVKFRVDYIADPLSKPYGVWPTTPSGEVADGDGNKWYNQEVKITPSTGYTMKKGTTEYSSANPLTFSTSAGANELAKDSLSFKASGKYVIKKTYPEAAEKYYVDTVKPVSGNTGKAIGITSTPTTAGYFKDNVNFNISVKDEHSGLAADTDHVRCYVSDGRSKTEVTLTSLTCNDGKTVTGSGTIDTSSLDNSSGTITVSLWVKDKAGNVVDGSSGETTADFRTDVVTVDKQKPQFWSNKDKKREISSTTGQEDTYPIYFVAEGKTKKILVTDNVGLKSVKRGSEDVEIGEDKKSVLVPIGAPSGNTPEDTTITVMDFAGNENAITIRLYKATVDIDDSTVLFGDATVTPDPAQPDETTKGSIYGYVGTSIKQDLVLKVRNPRQVPINLSARITEAKLQSAEPKFTLTGTAPNYTIQPKEELDVGTYTDTVEVEYDLVQEDTSEVLSEHSVNIPISFTIVKKELTVTYLGNTEFFHAKADYTFKTADTCGKDYDTKPELAVNERFVKKNDGTELAAKITGFVYGQAAKDGLAAWVEPKLPGIGTRHGISPGDSESKTPDISEAAAKNYSFKAAPGTMKCVRRELPEGVTVVGTEGTNDWYTSAVTISPSDTAVYEIMDHTAKVGDDGTDNEPFNPTKDQDVDGFSSAGFQFYNETTGVTKYFYIHNKSTDEVSLLMKKTVKIDRTRPHETYKAEPEDPTDAMYDKQDGTISDKPESNAPYLSVDSKTWYKFLHTITFGMYFNASTEVGVKQVFDTISGITDISYLILDKSVPGQTPPTEALMDGGEWTSIYNEGSGGTEVFNTSFNVTETDIDEGYLYVRITNGAGLKTYVTIDDIIIFDSKGPSIAADHSGQTPVSPAKEFEDGADFIAETVEFTISDSNLHTGTAGDPAVRVYKGTDISVTGEELTDKQIINAAPEGQEKGATTVKLTLNCPHYGDPDNKSGKQTYTIVAKDDSGFVTIRYFTIWKPVYNINVNEVAIPSQTYGYKTADSVKVTWKNAEKSNADPIVTGVTIDATGAKYFDVSGNTTDGWKVTPKEKAAESDWAHMHAGVYSGVVTVTYKDTDNGSKTANAKVSFRVDKKELTATYLGDTARLGTIPSSEGKLSVSGFLEDEGREAGGNKKKASGYEDPVINIPATVRETTIIEPSGGKADDYRFTYVGGVLTIIAKRAEKDTEYTVSGTRSDTGWYVSNITIRPMEGFTMSSDENGVLTMPEILITDDTADGEKKFYIKNTKTGEMYEQSIFNYKKDVVKPEFKGIRDGEIYVENNKEVTVLDDNLMRVSVNGVGQDVSAGKSVFSLTAEQTQQIFFIVAEDRAGHISTMTVTLKQPDGGADDDDVTGDDFDDPNDDVIQDDTEDGEDTGVGTLTKKVQLIDEPPATRMTSTNSELKAAVLTSAERAVMKEGSDAHIRLCVKNIDGSVSQGDKEMVIRSLGDYTVAQYLDITLWKTVGSGKEKQVHTTSRPISVSVTIPESLRYTKSGKRRQFAFIRVHNDATAVLQDQDSATSTITIATNKFSVYALAYRDTDVKNTDSGKDNGNSNAGNGGNGSGGGSGSGGSTNGGGSGYGGGSGSGGSSPETGGVSGAPQTGDEAPILPTAIGFGVALIGMITVIIIRRRMDYEWVYVDEDGNEIVEETSKTE